MPSPLQLLALTLLLYVPSISTSRYYTEALQWILQGFSDS